MYCICGGIRSDDGADALLLILMGEHHHNGTDQCQNGSEVLRLEHQDADIVTFLHRNRDEAKDLPRGQSTKAEVIIEKNRNGQIGVVNLLFFPYRTEFCPASPHSEDEMPESAR